MPEAIDFLSAVLLVSKDAPRLAAFYRDVLGVPLEDEQHGASDLHWGCELGDLHFAIHPASNFASTSRKLGVGAIKLAFTVFDIRAKAKALAKKGVKLLYPPQDVGFGWMTAVRDPDGNLVELTQLSDGWFRHLAKRRKAGYDVLARWKASAPRTRPAPRKKSRAAKRG